MDGSTVTRLDARSALAALSARIPTTDGVDPMAYEIRAFEHRQHEDAMRARRARRAEILDREMPGELSTEGRRAAIVEMQPHPVAASMILSWANRAVADRITPALCVVGERGVGKTVAAAWWIADTDGRYVLSTELVRLWKAEWGTDREAWVSLKRARTLVVDEVGGERHRIEDVRGMLEELVNARQNANTRTLFLGNITARQWAERLTPRAASRWNEVGYTLELSAKLDMRRRRAA